MVRPDDGVSGWLPKGSLDNCPPCFFFCIRFCCGCVFTVHADFVEWRLCPRATCIGSLTRDVLSVRCVGLCPVLFHLIRFGERHGFCVKQWMRFTRLCCGEPSCQLNFEMDPWCLGVLRNQLDNSSDYRRSLVVTATRHIVPSETAACRGIGGGLFRCLCEGASV